MPTVVKAWVGGLVHSVSMSACLFTLYTTAEDVLTKLDRYLLVGNMSVCIHFKVKVTGSL